MVDGESAHEARKNRFEFDSVLPEDSLQSDVFAELEPVLKSSLEGCNVCIFAYGKVRAALRSP